MLGDYVTWGKTMIVLLANMLPGAKNDDYSLANKRVKTTKTQNCNSKLVQNKELKALRNAKHFVSCIFADIFPRTAIGAFFFPY